MPFLPFIPFLDCAEVVIRGVNSATAAYVTFGAKYVSAPALSDLDALGAIVQAWIQSDLLPNVCNTYAAHDVLVTGLTSATDPSSSTAVTPPEDGQVVSTAVSNQDALVMTMNTALRGRSYRGRVYIPALPASARVNGTLWTTAVIAVWNAAWGTLQSNMLTGGWTLSVLSRQNNNVRRTTGVATPVTTILGRQPIGTQRRRIIGRGI